MLYFITGNANKFAEVKEMIPDVEQMDLDLPEIQEIDGREIIKAKLTEAMKHHEGEFMVEDTSLYLDCLGGLPGPLIKWFMQVLGRPGLYEMVSKYGNFGAEAKTIIGYAKNADDIHFFEGSMRGTIVPPDAESKFGWDPLFKPEGHDRTYAEMTKEEKTKISHRSKAVKKLQDFFRESGEGIEE